MTISVKLPIRIVSVANQREHWRQRAKRAAEERWLAKAKLNAFMQPAGRCVVTLVRIAPRPLDDDNLCAAFKAVRDGVADWLGVKDNSPLVKWNYRQERGRPKEYEALIVVEAADVQ